MKIWNINFYWTLWIIDLKPMHKMTKKKKWSVQGTHRNSDMIWNAIHKRRCVWFISIRWHGTEHTHMLCVNTIGSIVGEAFVCVIYCVSNFSNAINLQYEYIWNEIGTHPIWLKCSTCYTGFWLGLGMGMTQKQCSQMHQCSNNNNMEDEVVVVQLFWFRSYCKIR